MKNNVRSTLGRIGRTFVPATASERNLEQVTQKAFQIQREGFVLQLLQQPRYADARRLNRFEHRVFSQSGQDGILDEIFRRIGVKERTFVEFGVGAGGGFENNTTYLLAKGWSGGWIDADPEACARIRRQMSFLIENGRLKLRQGLVDAENILELFKDLGVAADFDLLSVDIDSTDYWVWQKITTAHRPRVVVIEYNSFLPASAQWVLPYNPGMQWEEMPMKFGASLLAFEQLGREMGYRLVGCDVTGSDAFFVREDLVTDSFCGPFTAAEHYEPMRYHLIQPWGYRRSLSADFGTIS